MEWFAILSYRLHFLLVGRYHWDPASAVGSPRSWNGSAFSGAAVEVTGADFPGPSLHST
jgi:hypothetical protein